LLSSFRHSSFLSTFSSCCDLRCDFLRSLQVLKVLLLRDVNEFLF